MSNMGGLNYYPFYVDPFSTRPNLTQPGHLPPLIMMMMKIYIPLVLDMDGKPLKIEEEYIIVSVLTGGGNVYLADVGNTKCPNGVAAYNSEVLNQGQEVKIWVLDQGHSLGQKLDSELISGDGV
uniref:Sexual organ expressed protein n=1 Tax=Solanum tuberosum TaxID=4113 RepID=M1AMX9_SOLTU